MAISLKHSTLSTAGPYTPTGELGPTEWNDEHAITMATARLLGRTSASTGAVEELTVGGGLTLAGGALSGGTEYTSITLGTADVLASAGASNSYTGGDVKMFSATKGVAAWKNNSDGYLKCCVFDISGTTVTAGTAVDVAAYSVQDQVSVEIMDSTTVVFIWGKSSDEFRYAKAATVSGTVLTFGSEVEIGDTITMSDHESVKLTSTTLMVGMIGSATSDLYSVILSLSGTTITDGTLNTDVRTTNSIEAMILAEAGQVLVLIDDGSTLNALNIAFTGTTINSVDDFNAYVAMGLSTIESSNATRSNAMRLVGTDVVFSVSSGTVNSELRLGSTTVELISDGILLDAGEGPAVSKALPAQYAYTTHLAEINSSTAFLAYYAELKVNVLELGTTNGRFSSLIESSAFMTTALHTFVAYNFAHLGSRKFVMFYRDGATNYPSVLVGSY